MLHRRHGHDPRWRCVHDPHHLPVLLHGRVDNCIQVPGVRGGGGGQLGVRPGRRDRDLPRGRVHNAADHRYGGGRGLLLQLRPRGTRTGQLVRPLRIRGAGRRRPGLHLRGARRARRAHPGPRDAAAPDPRTHGAPARRSQRHRRRHRCARLAAAGGDAGTIAGREGSREFGTDERRGGRGRGGCRGDYRGADGGGYVHR
ncbi:unnamed protein product [Ectocarpus sp. 4 AP-2014]